MLKWSPLYRGSTVLSLPLMEKLYYIISEPAIQRNSKEQPLKKIPGQGVYAKLFLNVTYGYPIVKKKLPQLYSIC